MNMINDQYHTFSLEAVQNVQKCFRKFSLFQNKLSAERSPPLPICDKRMVKLLEFRDFFWIVSSYLVSKMLDIWLKYYVSQHKSSLKIFGKNLNLSYQHCHRYYHTKMNIINDHYHIFSLEAVQNVQKCFRKFSLFRNWLSAERSPLYLFAIRRW